MLTTEQIAAHKEKLIATEADLQKQVIELETTPEFGSDTDHGEEESDETEEFGNNLGKAKAFRARLEDIAEALRKIDAGTYGTCEQCGGAIDNDLLTIDPESRLCKTCKLKERAA